MLTVQTIAPIVESGGAAPCRRHEGIAVVGGFRPVPVPRRAGPAADRGLGSHAGNPPSSFLARASTATHRCVPLDDSWGLRAMPCKILPQSTVIPTHLTAIPA